MKKIAPLAWREVDFNAPRRLPTIPCCYAIFSGDRLMYVGQTISLGHRLWEHGLRPSVRTELRFGKSRFGDPASLRVKVKLSVKYGDWLMREARLLRRLNPPLNARGQATTMQSRRPHPGHRKNWTDGRDTRFHPITDTHPSAWPDLKEQRDTISALTLSSKPIAPKAKTWAH